MHHPCKKRLNAEAFTAILQCRIKNIIVSFCKVSHVELSESQLRRSSKHCWNFENHKQRITTYSHACQSHPLWLDDLIKPTWQPHSCLNYPTKASKFIVNFQTYKDRHLPLNTMSALVSWYRCREAFVSSWWSLYRAARSRNKGRDLNVRWRSTAKGTFFVWSFRQQFDRGAQLLMWNGAAKASGTNCATCCLRRDQLFRRGPEALFADLLIRRALCLRCDHRGMF